MFVYLWSTVSYNSTNQILFQVLIREESVNPLLLNSINKYHPFVFYSSITLLVLWVLQTTCCKVSTIKDNFTKSIQPKPELYVLLIATTLSWGGWWAAQEGSWGGWWNWDPSEVFGLMLMLIYVYKTHLKAHKIKFFQEKYLVSLWWWGFVFIYYFIQLNFDLVSHNFGTRNHQFLDSYSLFLIILILVLVKLVTVFKEYVPKNKIVNLQPTTTSPQFLLIIVLLLTFFVLCASFTELLINLLWMLFTINVLNFSTELNYLILTLLIILGILFYRLNVLSLVVMLCFIDLSWTHKLVMLTLVSLSKFSKLHTITWSWITLSILYINHSISEWDLPILNVNSQVDYFNLKLSNFSIEHLILDNSNYWHCDSIWGLLRNTSSMTQPSFAHDNSLNTFSQTLKTFLLELSHSINISDYNTNILALVSLLWLWYLFKATNTKPVIIF
jgi:hypothetical protein